jgi:oligopeptide transport system ATP-binding protein
MSLLTIENLYKYFPVHSGPLMRVTNHVQAVRNITLSINHGETLGLVGESGCGKTTLARTIIRLLKPDAGKILFEGNDLTPLSSRELRPIRPKIQMIFQDPYSSLNPRMTVGDIITEPLLIHKKLPRRYLKKRSQELLELVGLSSSDYGRYPHEFSGGQRQRVGIARAIALEPKLIIADEPVSALDVSIASQIINLLQDLQDELKTTYLFISHDLKMVKHMSHRIAVMYLGEIVEIGPAEDFLTPLHPYTVALTAAIPIPDPTANRKRIILSGEPPSPQDPPSGCRFHPRCPYAQEICRQEVPTLKEWRPGHMAACHLVDSIEKEHGQI